MESDRVEVLQILNRVSEENPFFTVAREACRRISEASRLQVSETTTTDRTAAELADLYAFRGESLQRRRGEVVDGAAVSIGQLSTIHESVVVVTVNTGACVIDLFWTRADRALVGCLIYDRSRDRR